MKKGFLLLVLTALCMMGFAQQAEPQWTNVLNEKPETFRIQLVSSTENSIKVNVQVPGFYATTVTTPRGEAKIISVPKSVSTAKAGEPDMPMTGIPVMIGDKARMNVRVIDAQYMDFEGVEVAPSKGDFPRTIDPETVPYTYGKCYSQDAFFPTSNLNMYEPYILRDFRGQNMAVYPFAYNPASKTLRVYYNMTVEMYKVDDKGSNVIESRRSNVVKMNQDFKSMYQRHFINYEASMAKYTALNEDGDLLIICYDNFISSMTDFVNWKKTRGINTTIVGTTTAGSTYSAIKTYIQNQYNANNNITHVLLVGDVAQIPGYSYSGGGSSYSGLGDNAYGQIVGSDIYNDVIIGRFSASSAARVTTQCNRAITYERDLTTSDTWLQVAEGISRKEGGSGHNSEDDYQHMNNIRTDLLNYGYSPVYQRYANLTGYDGSSSTISSDINSGVGIINYTNHGQETAWGANSSGYIYYSVSHVNALTNENKLPFIWSVACLVGKYDHSSDCFAEAWMNATNNNNPTGAIGTLMSYISQPWIPPMWAQDECVDILTGNSSTTNNKHSWGGLCINGLFGIFDNYSTSSQEAVGTYQAWIVYGDPSLMVRSKTPQAMTVTHTGSLPLGNSSYNVTVSNGNGAVATITDANHNILGKATVSNGSATINLSGTLTANQQLTLCVFGYNKVTYLGTITVTGGTQYTISASASPTAGGSVSGAGQYYENTECTLTATANNHYEFTKWTKNGTQVSTDNPYTFTVTGNATYVANFTALTAHTVTCSTVQNGTISASPTSAYKGETITLTATPAAGYCLGTWTVKDANNNTITVTNNQFTMPDSNVTVSATFVVGYNVTLVPAINGTISANPTNGPAGTTVTLTASPDAGYNFDSWVVYKTGDLNTTVTVSNNTFTMPSYDVTVVGIFAVPTGGDVTIGGDNYGTTNGGYLPTHVWYKYSLTQQIYTAEEIGTAGTITAISFYYTGSTSSGARTIQVYMAHTTSSSISSWQTQSSGNLVYSGSYTFTQGWNTITLNTPFAYNGTNNVILTFDDNTGSYSVSSTQSFYTYSTGSTNRAIRYYSDSNNLSATSSNSTSGTALAYNNVIKLTKETQNSDGFLSVSPTSLSGFTAVGGGNASDPKSVDVIGANLQGNATITAPNGYEVSVSENGTYASTLTLTASSGSIRKVVYVRLKAGLSEGNYNGTMTIAAGTANVSVSLSGTVTPGSGTQYTISVNADPAVGGTVTGAGTYYENGTCNLNATANTGYVFDGWQLNGNIVSTSPAYSFTVTGDATYTAIFSEVPAYHVTVSQVPNGTISADKATAYPGETVTLSVNPNSGFLLNRWLVYKTGDVNTTITVNDNAFVMPEYDVTVFAVIKDNPEITIGSGTDTELGWALPTHVYYSYCLSQQIYTAAEIGEAGTITAFKLYFAGTSAGAASSTGARNLAVYMNHTNSSTISSYTAVSSSNLVYSGTVTFEELGWYTFTLTTPFEYDGSSNLMLTVDDNTGSYTVSERHYFRDYDSGTTKAVYMCSDNTNYNPLNSISSTTYTTTYNNQIVFVKEGAGPMLTALPNPMTGFSYKESQGPSEALSFAIIGVDLTSNVTVTAPADYQICKTENGTYTSSLTFTKSDLLTANVYVKLKAGLAQGSYNETLTVSSGSVTNSVSLVGEVTQGDYVNYSITAAAYPTVGGTVTGAGTYQEGSQATLTATANEGYTFSRWTKNGTQVSTNATYTFNVNESADYVAIFTLNTYTITALVNPENAGTVTGAGTYSHGDGVVLIATANEGYSFVNWTENGNVVCVNTTCTSTATADRTLVANFEVSAVSETVSLSTGWYWWSTYLDIDINQLKSAVGTNASNITSHNGTYTYLPNVGWLGNFALDQAQMYKIYVTSAFDLELSGMSVNPEDYPITINHGVNWIGYPVSYSMDVNNALAGLEAAEGDVIKWNKKMAMYSSGSWVGTLANLEPNKGYTYKSNASSSKTFTYPTNSKGSAVQVETAEENTYWSSDWSRFADNMNVVAVVEIDGVEAAGDNIEIGAFVGDECRGSVRLMYVEQTNRYLAFMTIQGENDETLSFRVMDGSAQREAEEVMTLRVDAVVGNVKSPFVLHVGSNELNLFPNPANKGEGVTLTLPSIAGMNGAKVEVFNAIGTLVGSINANSNSVKLEGILTSGIYTVKVTDRKGNVQFAKLVVR